MRIVFSGVPAHGHLLPLIPFVRAARRLGHEVAVLTAASMTRPLEAEIPGVELLVAGPDPAAIVTRVAADHPGADPVNDPRPDTVADFFAGARVDLAYDESLVAVRRWGADLVVSEAVDHVGPILAAALDLPHALVAFGPALPAEFTEPMLEIVRPRYRSRGLQLRPPVAVVDPAPRSLQPPGWTPDPLTLAYRAEPYRREPSDVPGRHSDDDAGTDMADGAGTDLADGAGTDLADGNLDARAAERRPSVLVTLGTVFTDETLLRSIVASVRAAGFDVVATLGGQTEPPVSDDPVPDAAGLSATVRYERFRPLAELLPGVDAVVTTGGAGTVLAAASHGLPMVILPQGADQPINAARAAAAGVAVIEPDPTAVGLAVTHVLTEPTFVASGREVQEEIALRPSADTVVREIVRRAGDAALHRPPFDPELELALVAMHESVPTTMTPEMIPLFRAGSLPGPTPEEMLRAAGLEARTVHIPTQDGAMLTASVVQRTGRTTTAPRPGFVHLHGGGMVAGDRWTGFAAIVDWIVRLDAVAVTVDYRLAPEHPAPTPVEDCYASLLWTADHADHLGLDPDRLVVVGSSAGAGLAAGVALLARDRQGPALAAQVLMYPMLDDRDRTTSTRQIDGVGFWDRGTNRTGWRALLGERYGTDDVPAAVAPARASDLSGLPPTFIDCGSAEVFRDEDVAYASAIWAAGGEAELHVWPGGFHSFDQIAPHAMIARDMVATRDRWIRRILG
jgi:acetyl esterase/lipase